MIKPVEVNDLFPDEAEKEKQDKLKLASSDPITQDGSIFTAFAIKMGQIHEIRRAHSKISRANPGAAHVIAAYNTKNHRGHQDDSEFGAGYRIMNLLENNYVPNVAVIIVRVYGGIHIGPKRLTIMQEVAAQALERAGVDKKVK